MLHNQIWLSLGISIVCVIFVLTIIQQYFNQTVPTSTKRKKRVGRDIARTAGNQYRYVFGTLLSQGYSIYILTNSCLVSRYFIYYLCSFEGLTTKKMFVYLTVPEIRKFYVKYANIT